MKWLAMLALVSAPARAAECDGFSFALEQDGVRVFNRKIQGSSVREVCATVELDAPPADVYAVLLDVESYPSRLPPTVQVERVSLGLERVSSSESSYYMVIDPGFISRRDYCIATRGVRHDTSFEVAWRQVACPLRSSRLVRMVTNSGAWTIAPRLQGSAVVYQSHADPGGLVPPWLVNSATVRRLPEIMGALRRALRDDKVSRR